MNSPDPHRARRPAGNSFSHKFQFIDPRAEEDFDPKFYPTADGSAVPASHTKNRNERITFEFCAVYYQLNRLYARLIVTRKQVKNPERSFRERAILQEIEKSLRIRDELEDLYAPYGVIAETIMQNGFTSNIKFTFGDRNAATQRQTQFVSSSALLIFPKPADWKLREGEPCES
jgi:hypothetical protein